MMRTPGLAFLGRVVRYSIHLHGISRLKAPKFSSIADSLKVLVIPNTGSAFKQTSGKHDSETAGAKVFGK
jgi:hypothetical protein